MKASFVREVMYPDWLSNLVMAQKDNDKWRMCVKFVDLNKVYPKDPFLLPKIDQLVDSTTCCEMLSFLDVYLGYHQISMSKEDEQELIHNTFWGLLLR